MNITDDSRPMRARRRFDLRLALSAAACVSCGLMLVVAGAARAENEGAGPAVPSDNIEDHANLGLADSPRSADDLARDAAEKPAAIAAFATVGPRKRVAELRARDGYLTEVLALAAYPYGKVFANNDPGSLSNADSAAWNARLEKPELADIARYDLPLVAPLPQYAAGLDVVVSVGAYGDAIRRNLDRSAMNAAVLRALHPGGLYVIADARAAAGADGAALCRATEKQVREEVEAAGFRFVEASEALSEAGDARTNGACQTSPGRSLDRFMLKFEKPAAEPAAASGPSK